MSIPDPLPPPDTRPLFAPLGHDLVVLLRSLTPEDWGRPTVCSAWTVKEIAAHLLDTACRRISLDRDHYPPPAPSRPVTSQEELVTWLNQLNADWVRACRRLSPALLIDLLETAEAALVATLAALDPDEEARFAVTWAGEEKSSNRFDTARELTERWLHQQQIRLAVEAPPLTRPSLSGAIFATFLRALPPAYRATAADVGTEVGLTIVGEEDYRFVLRRQEEGWRLVAGSSAAPMATIRIAEEPAWLLFTKGIGGSEARSLAWLSGAESLVAPFFSALAVMA